VTTERRVHIRWMIRADMPQVTAMENECFEFPWSEDDFIRCLRQRNCIGMVITHNEEIAGYMIYELHKGSLEVLNFAVHPARQRYGFGGLMIQKLDSKLSAQRRSKIICHVRDSNLDAQMFFASQGFKAVMVLKDHYEDTLDDAYQFEYCYAGESVAEESQVKQVSK